MRRARATNSVGDPMFDDHPKNVGRFLRAAERFCIEKTNYDQNAALQELTRIIDQDRRFDHLDSAKVAQRTMECRHSGRVLDLDDPALRHGGAVYDVLKLIRLWYAQNCSGHCYLKAGLTDVRFRMH
jgi:hypothetical protein